jgi:hypothetical protein
VGVGPEQGSDISLFRRSGPVLVVATLSTLIVAGVSLAGVLLLGH